MPHRPTAEASPRKPAQAAAQQQDTPISVNMLELTADAQTSASHTLHHARSHDAQRGSRDDIADYRGCLTSATSRQASRHDTDAAPAAGRVRVITPSLSAMAPMYVLDAIAAVITLQQLSSIIISAPSMATVHYTGSSMGAFSTRRGLLMKAADAPSAHFILSEPFARRLTLTLIIIHETGAHYAQAPAAREYGGDARRRLT
jgi:hypothetical protein